MPKYITIVLPDEFQEVYDTLDNIARDNKQSLSRTAREMICNTLNFTTDRNVKKRNMYKNKTKKA